MSLEWRIRPGERRTRMKDWWRWDEWPDESLIRLHGELRRCSWMRVCEVLSGPRNSIAMAFLAWAACNSCFFLLLFFFTRIRPIFYIYVAAFFFFFLKKHHSSSLNSYTWIKRRLRRVLSWVSEREEEEEEEEGVGKAGIGWRERERRREWSEVKSFKSVLKKERDRFSMELK